MREAQLETHENAGPALAGTMREAERALLDFGMRRSDPSFSITLKALVQLAETGVSSCQHVIAEAHNSLLKYGIPEEREYVQASVPVVLRLAAKYRLSPERMLEAIAEHDKGGAAGPQKMSGETIDEAIGEMDSRLKAKMRDLKKSRVFVRNTIAVKTEDERHGGPMMKAVVEKIVNPIHQWYQRRALEGIERKQEALEGKKQHDARLEGMLAEFHAMNSEGASIIARHITKPG